MVNIPNYDINFMNYPQKVIEISYKGHCQAQVTSSQLHMILYKIVREGPSGIHYYVQNTYVYTYMHTNMG